MKILLTTDTYEPAINGVATSVKNLYKQLKENGHDVRVLTLSPTIHNQKVGDIYYIRSFSANKIYPNVRGTIPFESKDVEEIIEWKPEIIHTNSEFFTFIYANAIAHELRIPIVHTYHTMYEYYTSYVFKFIKVGKRTVSTIIRRTLKNVDAIIAPTLKVKKSLESYGISHQMYIIPTGISLDKFLNEIPEDEIDALKKMHNIPKDKKVIVTVGRLGAEKNLDEVMENFGVIKELLENVVLVIVGDGPYRTVLENEVKKYGLEDLVVFTGMVKPDDIHKYYKLGDIFVSASNSETQGLTYIEALASGRPVICKEDEVLEGIVENGINGYTYNKKEEFIDYVNKLLSDEKLYKLMSEGATITAREFSMEKFGEKAENLYKHLIENNDGERTLLYEPLIMAKKVKRGMMKSMRVHKKNLASLKITK